jgi:hypothetical protein
MRERVAIVIAAVVGCGGGESDGDIIAATTMVLGEQTGAGPSPLDPLLGRSIAFEVDVAAALITHATVESCRWTVHESDTPVASAMGGDAAFVQAEILDRLPAWDLTLALCEPANQSSVTLHADFEGLAVIAGCLELPASSQVRDGDGEPRWTDFTGARCEATVYDQLHGRLFTAHEVTMRFERAPR